MSRADWSRACRVARSGGCLPATLPNLRAAYLIVNERWPHAEINRLAVE